MFSHLVDANLDSTINNETRNLIVLYPSQERNLRRDAF